MFSFNGDYNADGYKDLCTGDIDDSRIRIFYGNAQGTYNEDPNLVKETEVYMNIFIVDLNGDKKDEIVMFDPEGGQFNIVYF